jgi:hypothetical protein
MNDYLHEGQLHFSHAIRAIDGRRRSSSPPESCRLGLPTRMTSQPHKRAIHVCQNDLQWWRLGYPGLQLPQRRRNEAL